MAHIVHKCRITGTRTTVSTKSTCQYFQYFQYLSPVLSVLNQSLSERFRMLSILLVLVPPMAMGQMEK